MSVICVICFSDILGLSLTCVSPDCKSEICVECAKGYMKYSCEQNEMMKCPDTNCKAHFVRSEVNKLGKELVKSFERVCCSYLLIENETTDSKTIVERLRQERLTFINGHFPIAITAVISIALKKQLKSIDKQNLARMQKILNKRRNCFNILCCGQLDNKFECNVCSTNFCNKCEKVSSSQHKCMDEDVESVKFVNDLVKCPKCKFPIIRSYGCNMMTCSVCRTNFHYVTGVVTSAGNHNAHATFTVKNDENTIVRYADKYSGDILEHLSQIEKHRPVQSNLNDVVNSLKAYKQTTSDDIKTALQTKISVKYEKYLRNKYERMHFYKCISKVQELDDTNTMSIKSLNKILACLKN